MINKVPLSELKSRMQRFISLMDKANRQWEMVIVISKINQYYFTGTMQEGMLIIPKGEQPVLFIRRSYERAVEESLFTDIRPMNSYRDAAGYFDKIPGTVHLETEIVPLAMLQRIQKYFPFNTVKPADPQLSAARAIKSPYELDLMKRAGEIHRRVLEERVPALLKEGMTEAELAGELFPVMLEEGHQGVVRFGMFDTEIILGHVAFGESSLYPTAFNGPGGNYGMGPAVPSLGSRERKLAKGDLVFVDVACGVEGYHTDKTVTYMFGAPLPQKAIDEHRKCVELQDRMAEMLKPGAIPAEIYNSIMNGLDESFLENFMGFGKRKVKFLGHGIGLLVDEQPVIAEGFVEPLEEGIAFALEPKKGIANIGMVGIENTFLVTAGGGLCITGSSPGLLPVY